MKKNLIILCILISTISATSQELITKTTLKGKIKEFTTTLKNGVDEKTKVCFEVTDEVIEYLKKHDAENEKTYEQMLQEILENACSKIIVRLKQPLSFRYIPTKKGIISYDKVRLKVCVLIYFSGKNSYGIENYGVAIFNGTEVTIKNQSEN
jgi:hypothetical protein